MLSSVVFFLALTVGFSQTVVAQQVISNPLHAFALNRDKVLRIEGHLVAAFDAGIEVYDNYTGRVTARLGEVAVKSRLLKIQRAEGHHQADLKVIADGGEGFHVQSIEAAGDVVITAGDLTAVGERLVFEMRQDTSMLAGDVVVWLGPHVMRGGRLTTSMANGAARLEGTRAVLGDRVPVHPTQSEHVAELVPYP